jgi:hypothetical protein
MQRQYPLGVSFLFEKLLASGEQVELRDETLKSSGVRWVDDGDYADATRGHSIRYRAEHFVRIGQRDGSTHGFAHRAICVTHPCHYRRPWKNPHEMTIDVKDRVEALAAFG